MSGVGTPTCTSVPARSRAKKACSITAGCPTASMQTSAPLPPVSPLIASTGSVALASTVWVAPNAVANSSFPGSLSTAMIDGRAGELRPGDGGAPDAAATEDGHGVAQADLARVHGGADAGHDAATEQPDRLGAGGRVDLRALAGGHQGPLGEGADAEGGGEGRPVGQRHLLRGVVRVEAVPGPAAPAGPALAADRPPVQDHEVAGRQVGHVGPDRFDDAGGLVAQQEREVVVDAALAVVEVGVAHPARLARRRRPRPARGRGPGSSRG